MFKITVDFSKKSGIVKPLHAVNNGPVYKFGSSMRITNMDAFIEAGIPYVRNHDAAFCAAYGGEHIVDVHAIFPNFDADPYDPESYDFIMTDEYVRVCEYAGCKTFYRLGSKIEHGIKKYGTLPPKDFHKWAVICEHIIRHYTEGWANGFRYDMEYWEIWNEADGNDDDAPDKLCWGGTHAEFYELYHITATHLKKCFPHLKIGGPAKSGRINLAEEFIKQCKAPLDFFSWHRYKPDPSPVMEFARKVRRYLDENGFEKTESILDEWNYVRSFSGDDWIYSLRREKDIKGAAYIAAMMCECQREPVDMLMYYDARPCGMNGMFNTDLVCDKLKGYYPFFMFNTLYKIKENVTVISKIPGIYLCAAADNDIAAVMVTHFNDDDATTPLTVELDLKNFGCVGGTEIEISVLDETHDLIPINKSTYFGTRFKTELAFPNFTSYLIKLKSK